MHFLHSEGYAAPCRYFRRSAAAVIQRGQAAPGGPRARQEKRNEDGRDVWMHPCNVAAGQSPTKTAAQRQEDTKKRPGVAVLGDIGAYSMSISISVACPGGFEPPAF